MDQLLDIVGVVRPARYGNARQVEIRRCRPGEPVILRLEHGQRDNADLIAVDSVRGITIGYMPPDYAHSIGSKLEVGCVRAIIEQITERTTGGIPGKPPLSVCLRINIEGEAPDMSKRRGWQISRLRRFARRD